MSWVLRPTVTVKARIPISYSKHRVNIWKSHSRVTGTDPSRGVMHDPRHVSETDSLSPSRDALRPKRKQKQAFLLPQAPLDPICTFEIVVKRSSITLKAHMLGPCPEKPPPDSRGKKKQGTIPITVSKPPEPAINTPKAVKGG